MRPGYGFTVAALILGCASPSYKSGDLRCAPTGKQCPDSFYCASDKRCWSAGSGPDAGLPQTDLAMGGNDLSNVPPPDLLGLAGLDLAHGSGTCSGSTALLCDSFEAATLDAQWKIVGAGASAGLDTTRAFRGTQSIHVHSDSAAAMTDPDAAIVETRTFPVVGTVWVRGWFYFQSPFSVNFNQVINFIDMNTGGASYAIQNDVAINNNYGGAGYRASTMTVPIDRWTCLRMSLGQGGSTGDIHLFIDDVEAADAQLLGTTVTTMRELVLGADFFGNPAMGSTDMWIDDVIVDNKLIKCSD